MGTRNSIRPNEIDYIKFIFDFFQIFMIRFGQIDLAINPIGLNEFQYKRGLTQVRFGWTESWKFQKNQKNNSNFFNSFGRSFYTLLIHFDFDLVRIKFESFTNKQSWCKTYQAHRNHSMQSSAQTPIRIMLLLKPWAERPPLLGLARNR